MVKGFPGLTFWVWSQGGCKLQKFVIDSYRVKISLCVPWPTPTGSNFPFFCYFRNQSFARWQFMMNIYNTFPWEVYVKIGHLGPSVIPLNSQVGNSNSKKKIRKLPLQQFFPIKMDFFETSRSPESKKSPLQNPVISHLLKDISGRASCLYLN